MCTDTLYRYGLMRSCWDADPAKRPSFSELVSTFDNLLSVAHVSTFREIYMKLISPAMYQGYWYPW